VRMMNQRTSSQNIAPSLIDNYADLTSSFLPTEDKDNFGLRVHLSQTCNAGLDLCHVVISTSGYTPEQKQQPEMMSNY